MLYTLLVIAILNIIYLVGFIVSSLLLKITEPHYFLGFGSGLFTFQLRGVKFSVGLYIPIVGLSRIYAVVNGKKEPARYPWEFFQHSITRRLLATLGGPVALLLAGIITFIGATYFQEESIITKEEVNRHGIYPSDWAGKLGFQRGDRIVAVNGKDYTEFSELVNPAILLASGTYYTVQRDGREIDIQVKDMPFNFVRDRQLFISLLAPFEISVVMPNSAAEKVGIKPGDRIKKVNERPIAIFRELYEACQNDEDGNITLEVERSNNESVEILNFNVSLDHEKRMGIAPKEMINYTIKKNTLWQAITKGSYAAFNVPIINIRALGKVIGGSVSSTGSLSGSPVRIAEAPYLFWWIAGTYAVFFAFWNLLPLPKSALWEMIPLAYEGITKKKYSYTTFKTSLSLAWIPLVAIFVWILISDLMKLLS